MAKAERDVQRRLRCVSTDFLPKSDDSLCRGKLGSKRQGLSLMQAKLKVLTTASVRKFHIHDLAQNSQTLHKERPPHTFSYGTSESVHGRAEAVCVLFPLSRLPPSW